MAPATAPPAPTMDQAQAQAFRDAHDAEVRALNRLRLAELRRAEAAELAAAGYQRLSGGPHSRGELIAAILEFRYPLAKLNESIHVLYHPSPGQGSSACKFCHPHDGLGCDCELSRP